jgi:hypothetical protein
MRRQEAVLGLRSGPRYDVVLDARALLLGLGGVDLIRGQVLALAERAEQVKRLDLRVIPLGKVTPVFSTVGFTLYDFRAAESPPVAWIEAPTGDVYFSAPEDVKRYAELFSALQHVALSPQDSIGYLRSFAANIERYLEEPIAGNEEACNPIQPTPVAEITSMKGRG